jgi:hypothetical protein
LVEVGRRRLSLRRAMVGRYKRRRPVTGRRRGGCGVALRQDREEGNTRMRRDGGNTRRNGRIRVVAFAGPMMVIDNHK